jgi:hypothetical protein
MSFLRRWLGRGTFFLLFAVAGHATTGHAGAVPAASCDTAEHLDETAQQFIARCCQGSVHSKFPGQFYHRTLGEIRSAANAGDRDAKTAWKLVNDGRFRK